MLHQIITDIWSRATYLEYKGVSLRQRLRVGLLRGSAVASACAGRASRLVRLLPQPPLHIPHAKAIATQPSMIKRKQGMPASRTTQLFTCLAVCCLSITLTAQTFPQTIEQEGIQVSCDIQHLDPNKTSGIFTEGDDIRFQFRVSETLTDEGLSGVYPAGWLVRKNELKRRTCQQKVEDLLEGNLFNQADLDLNVYYVLSLNEDATISVVDPLFGYGTTKLLTQVQLNSPGMDWTLSNDQKQLFVSMPKAQQIAVINTNNWETITNVDLPGVPVHTAIQADGAYLWVTYVTKTQDDQTATGVVAISTNTHTLKATIPTGAGWHELALSDDNHYAFVTNSLDASISVIDITTLKKIKDYTTDEVPTAITWSTQAQAAIVGYKENGKLLVFDGKTHTIRATTYAEKGIEQLTMAPDGRFAFIVNPDEDVVHIFDTANNRIVQTADTEDEPDRVSFTDELAYVRHRASEVILMIPLKTIGQPNKPVHAFDFPGGQNPAGKTDFPSPAAGIVQTPGESAVLVANPLDKTVYYYMEGMAAPVGNFSNYGKQPRAVLVVDRTLREVDKGSYETVINLRTPGIFDLVFFMNAPRLMHCFSLEIKADPEKELQRKIDALGALEVEYLTNADALSKEEASALRFRLRDRRTGMLVDALEDVQVMLMQSTGRSFEKRWADPTDEPGLYAVDLAYLKAGAYKIYIECASKNMSMGQSPVVLYEITD